MCVVCVCLGAIEAFGGTGIQLVHGAILVVRFSDEVLGIAPQILNGLRREGVGRCEQQLVTVFVEQLTQT